MKTYDKFYINGQWVDPKGTDKLSVIDPSTEEICGEVPSGNNDDVNDAVAAAKAAFKTWGQSSAAERSALIKKLSEKVTENMQKIGELCALELGTPLQTSIAVHGGMGVGVVGSYVDVPFEMEKEEQPIVDGFVDAQEMHRMYPTTFEVPTEEELSSLKYNDRDQLINKEALDVLKCWPDYRI